MRPRALPFDQDAEARAFAKTFGTRLRMTREALGLAAADVAHEIGVVAGCVSNWERGENLPKLWTNLRLQAYLRRVAIDQGKDFKALQSEVRRRELRLRMSTEQGTEQGTGWAGTVAVAGERGA